MGDEQTPKLQVLRMACDPQQWQELRCARFTVADVMTSPPFTVSAAQSPRDLDKLMSERRTRHALVTGQEGKLLGIISDRDLLRIHMLRSRVQIT